MKIIKPHRYEINPSLSVLNLLDAGFKQGYWLASSEPDYVEDHWYSKNYMLESKGEIEMTIAIDITRLSEWNDFDGIEVIDEDFGQPYQPFYEYREKRGKHLIAGQFPFLERVYRTYDKEMDNLVEQGIFVRKVFA
mgnify:FL=1